MIISHKYKFIFIKTAKTAGTSIEVFLSPICGGNDVLTPIFPHVEPHVARNYEANGFKNHMAAQEIKNRVEPAIWKNYFKFCVDHNLWDKVLSYYHMVNYLVDDNLRLNSYFENGSFPTTFEKYKDQTRNVTVD